MSQNDTSKEFDRARDELFSHIHRCGVLRATPEQQTEWMDDTMEYMAERFPELSEAQLSELRGIGIRFCQPVIANGQPADADQEDGESAGAEAAAA